MTMSKERIESHRRIIAISWKKRNVLMDLNLYKDIHDDIYYYTRSVLPLTIKNSN